MPHNARQPMPAAARAPAILLVAVLATGCSGINASKSVSPLDFFLPGLLLNVPSSPGIPVETNAAPLVARAGAVPHWIQP
jgi:hypothetical protein